MAGCSYHWGLCGQPRLRHIPVDYNRIPGGNIYSILVLSALLWKILVLKAGWESEEFQRSPDDSDMLIHLSHFVGEDPREVRPK